MAKLEKMTKAQLVEAVRSLTQENKDLRKEKSKESADPSELGLKAVSIVETGDRKFKIVNLNFDLETGVGKVVGSIDFDKFYKASFELGKYVVEVLHKQKLEVK